MNGAGPQHAEAVAQAFVDMAGAHAAGSGLTVGSAYIPLGAINGIINYSVAVAKAALVLIFFMHLDRSRAAIRLAACVGVFWLVFLFSLRFPTI